jgi:hypothetical protein
VKKKWISFILIILILALLGGVVTACSIISPLIIIGKWQDNSSQNQIEFTWDRHIIVDSGGTVVTGTYEPVGDNYVKVKFDGFSGAWLNLFGGDTWKYQVSVDTMTLQTAGHSSTMRRIR